MKRFFREINLWARGNAANLSLFIIVAGFVGMFGLLAFQQQKIEQGNQQNLEILKSLSSITQRLVSGAQTRTDQYNELNQRMACIVQFFTQTDRGQKAIADIDTCALQNTKTGEVTAPLPPVVAPSPSPTPSATPTPSPKVQTNTDTPTTSKPTPTLLDDLLTPVNNLLKAL